MRRPVRWCWCWCSRRSRQGDARALRRFHLPVVPWGQGRTAGSTAGSTPGESGHAAMVVRRKGTGQDRSSGPQQWVAVQHWLLHGCVGDSRIARHGQHTWSAHTHVKKGLVVVVRVVAVLLARTYSERTVFILKGYVRHAVGRAVCTVHLCVVRVSTMSASTTRARARAHTPHSTHSHTHARACARAHTLNRTAHTTTWRMHHTAHRSQQWPRQYLLVRGSSSVHSPAGVWLRRSVPSPWTLAAACASVWSRANASGAMPSASASSAISPSLDRERSGQHEQRPQL